MALATPVIMSSFGMVAFLINDRMDPLHCCHHHVYFRNFCVDIRRKRPVLHAPRGTGLAQKLNRCSTRCTFKSRLKIVDASVEIQLLGRMVLRFGCDKSGVRASRLMRDTRQSTDRSIPRLLAVVPVARNRWFSIAKFAKGMEIECAVASISGQRIGTRVTALDYRRFSC